MAVDARSGRLTSRCTAKSPSPNSPPARTRSPRGSIGRLELGVFEFNHAARRLYEKLGYKEIGREYDFTYYDGRMWPDIRMEKELTA
jgi:hypothetical protein